MWRASGVLIAALVAETALSTVSAHAQQSVARFYSGKQLDVRVGSAPGSGYDLAARLIAPFIGRYLPGKPMVVVRNEPGAGGVTLMNELNNTLPRDGSVIAVEPNGMPTAHLFTPEAARFDPSRFGWIGSPAPETDVVVVWRTAPVQTYADLFTKQLVAGGIASGTATVDMPLITNAFAGTKFKVIGGYQSTGEINLAMQRGEVQGQAALGWLSLKSHNQAWLRDGTVKVIAQYGFEKNPDLPDVPLFELPKDEAGRQALTVMIARQEFGRPFLAPPGVPPDRLAALRHAFDLAMSDPDLLKLARQAEFDIHPITGERLQQLAGEISATNPAVIRRMREVLDPAVASEKH